jgi:hypothetical protein
MSPKPSILGLPRLTLVAKLLNDIHPAVFCIPKTIICLKHNPRFDFIAYFLSMLLCYLFGSKDTTDVVAFIFTDVYDHKIWR